MTAARKLDPDDEALIEALAERIVAKLRAPRPRRSVKASDTDRAAMRKVLAGMGLQPKRR